MIFLSWSHYRDFHLLCWKYMESLRNISNCYSLYKCDFIYTEYILDGYYELKHLMFSLLVSSSLQVWSKNFMSHELLFLSFLILP